MHVGTTNLLPRKQAKLRSIENQQKVLQFLRQEKFSTRQIIQQLLGLKTRAGAWKILVKMEQENWLKQHSISPALTLWGITPEGMREASLEETGLLDEVGFLPSKISLSTLQHSLDIQYVHTLCYQENIEFQLGKVLGSRAKADKVPDAIIVAGGKKIAVEVERTLKSRTRYDVVIYHYLKAIKAGNYQKVLYVMPDEKRYRQVKKAFYHLGHITMDINGRKQSLRLDPHKHFQFFDFIVQTDVSAYLRRLLP